MTNGISDAYIKRIDKILKYLGIKLSQFPKLNLPMYGEENNLQFIGTDIYNRPQFLSKKYAKQWFSLVKETRNEGIEIYLISAFRSVNKQQRIWERKLDSGQTIDQIIYNNAPPGYSEHHTGCAIDITTRSCLPFTTEFESTVAYQWLCENADRLDLTMSYPKNNKYGISYEPWHWSFGKALS